MFASVRSRWDVSTPVDELIDAFERIHGGHLTITDSPAGGTRMTVTLAHP